MNILPAWLVLFRELERCRAEIAGIDVGLRAKRGRSRKILVSLEESLLQTMEILRPLKDGKLLRPVMVIREPQACEAGLPCPRLQIVWRPLDEYRWVAEYMLVLEQKGSEHSSIRQDVHGRTVYLLGDTTVDHDPVSGEDVRLPYRDGAHIKWESRAMGNMPAFLIAKGWVKTIDTSEPAGG